MAIKMADIVARVTSQTQYSSLLAGDQFGFLSAKQYGAIGDGVADDSAAILKMLSAASASTHLALYFPTGVYKVDNVTLTSTHFSGYYLFGDNATFTGITKAIDQVGVTIGSLSDLNTVSKDSIVSALNELESGSFATYITAGTQGQYLVVASTSAKSLEAKDSPQKVMTAIGDMIYASAPNTIARVPIGTNFQNLSVNSSTNGFTYLNSMQSLMTAQGDMVYASSANNPVRLAKGTAYQGLIMNATTTAPQWAASLQSLMTAQGDMVYASTANTPTRLAKGTAYQAVRMTSDETAPTWGNVMLGEKQVFTSSTTFTAPKTGVYKVTVTGGGGGGGRTGTDGGGTNYYWGGGGGAGGTAIKFVSLNKNDSVTITVGTGGATGAIAGTAGSSGGTSSFGSHCSANGGTGSTVSSVSGSGGNGTGGSASNGDVNITGGSGNPGTSATGSGTAMNGFGGASFWGGQGAYGSGNQPSVAGVAGVILVEW